LPALTISAPVGVAVMVSTAVARYQALTVRLLAGFSGAGMGARVTACLMAPSSLRLAGSFCTPGGTLASETGVPT
jgi:hypothetical protein